MIYTPKLYYNSALYIQSNDLVYRLLLSKNRLSQGPPQFAYKVVGIIAFIVHLKDSIMINFPYANLNSPPSLGSFMLLF